MKKFLNWTCVFVLSSLSLSAFAQDSWRQSNIAVAQSGVAAQKQSLQSILFTVSESRTIFRNTGNKPVQKHYIWACNHISSLKKDKQDFQTEITLTTQKTVENRFYNGGDEKSGQLMQSNVLNRDVVATDANPLEGVYRIQDIWLYDLISTHDSIRPGVADVKFGPTIVVQGSSSSDFEYELTLAPKFGWICIQSKIVRRKNGIKSQTTTRLLSLQNKEGVWLPKTLEYHLATTTQKSPQMVPFVDTSLSMNVTSINNLEDSYFTLPPRREGSTVVDVQGMNRYKVNNGKLVLTDGPLVDRNNVWRWFFTGSTALALMVIVFFVVNRGRNTTSG